MKEVKLWVKKEGSSDFVEKMVPFWEAIELLFAQVISTLPQKKTNPLFFPVYNLTGHHMSITKNERRVDENAFRLRAFTNSFVKQRRKESGRE